MNRAWTELMGALSDTLDAADALGRRRRLRPLGRAPGLAFPADGTPLIDVSKISESAASPSPTPAAQ